MFSHTHTYTYTHTFTDPSSTHARLSAEIFMERAELHYEIKSEQWVIKLHKINKNMINNKAKNISTPYFKAIYTKQKSETCKIWKFIYLHFKVQ